MRKLSKPKDILLLILANIGDTIEEVKDPLHLVSHAYEEMYGFIPKKYKRNDFQQMLNRSLKTGDIEQIVKDGERYLRLTPVGRNKARRDFTFSSLTRTWNKKWVVITFDIEEQSRVIRDRLRKKLQSIGFGMFQESIWITPLPIGKDIWEFIDSLGLSKLVFVMEVSELLFGDPRELAKKIWHLDKVEEEYQRLKNEIKMVKQLLIKYNDRVKKREAKLPLSKPSLIHKQSLTHFYRLKNRERRLNKEYLEFVISFPPLPKELLPESLQDLQPLKLVK